MPSALVVEDHPSTRRGLTELLESRGFSVAAAPSLAAAEQHLTTHLFQAVILDVVLPDGNGLDLLLDMPHRQKPHVILISGETAVAETLQSLDFRSLRFLQKPVDPEALEQALKFIRNDCIEPTPPRDVGHRQADILGSSSALREVLELVNRVAATDLSVLIHGETGTGKELIAQAIHARSPRHHKPIVPLNCGAVPESLIDAELFGHVRGAFTGASQGRVGAFESADGGTLFLDEITEMPLPLQTRLLRVIETGRIKRVGDSKERPTDVRIVCATNRPPAAAMAEGTLREDLFHRLAAFPIHVPPLRQRGDDIALLARHFFADSGGDPSRIDVDAIETLKQHHWPGNIRQLKNVMQRLVVVSDDRVDGALVRAQLGQEIPRDRDLNLGVGSSIADVERRLIEATLAAKSGDKPAAARALGISLRTLYNRLDTYRRDTDDDS